MAVIPSLVDDDGRGLFVQIVYLEDGKVLEAGSHAELLRNGGKYAELWERQATSVTDQ